MLLPVVLVLVRLPQPLPLLPLLLMLSRMLLLMPLAAAHGATGWRASVVAQHATGRPCSNCHMAFNWHVVGWFGGCVVQQCSSDKAAPAVRARHGKTLPCVSTAFVTRTLPFPAAHRSEQWPRTQPAG